MQLILVSAILATVSALTATEHNANCDTSQAHVKIVNRCSYDVNLWSVEKQIGCPSDAGFTLKTGQTYNENFQSKTDGGISIKLSKFDTCGGHDITQLEYYISEGPISGNFIDTSFCDCPTLNCPGRTDGFYFKSGNYGSDQAIYSSVNNEHCPIFSVSNAVEAAAVSYINPDDRQTKFCPSNANLELYLCGGQAPGESSSSAPSYSAAPSSSKLSSSSSSTSKSTPSSSSQAKPTTTPVAYKPITTPVAYKPSSSDVEVKAAAITPAPVPEAPKAVKTVVEYVTTYVDAPAKRHVHGRRHQHYKS